MEKLKRLQDELFYASHRVLKASVYAQEAGRRNLQQLLIDICSQLYAESKKLEKEVKNDNEAN